MKYLVLSLLLVVIVTLIPGAITVSASTNKGSLFVSEINFRGSIEPEYKCVNPSKISEYETSVNFCWKDEWIEIFNSTQTSVNLNGWQLKFRNNEVVNLQGSISSGGYFTLGHTHLNESFESVISNFNQSSNKLIHLSSDTADNIFFQLINPEGDVVDSLSSSHAQIEGGVKQVGKSWGRCDSGSWRIQTKAIDQYNFGSPNTGNCEVVIPQEISAPAKVSEVAASPAINTVPATQPVVQVKSVEIPVPEKVNQQVPKKTINTVPAVSVPAKVQEHETKIKTEVTPEIYSEKALSTKAISIQKIKPSPHVHFADLVNLESSNLSKALTLEFINTSSKFSFIKINNLSLENIINNYQFFSKNLLNNDIKFNSFLFIANLVLTFLISEFMNRCRSNKLFYLLQNSYVTKS